MGAFSSSLPVSSASRPCSSGPGDGGPLERHRDAAAAERAPDRGHVVVGDGGAGGVVDQARVPGDIARGLVDGDEERVLRDPTRSTSRAANASSVPTSDRLVARRDVREGLQRRLLDARTRSGRSARVVSGSRRAPGPPAAAGPQVEPDHLGAVRLHEPAIGQEAVPVRVRLGQLGLEAGLAGRAGHLARGHVRADPSRIPRASGAPRSPASTARTPGRTSRSGRWWRSRRRSHRRPARGSGRPGPDRSRPPRRSAPGESVLSGATALRMRT